MKLPSAPSSPVHVVLATVPAAVDGAAVQRRFPERPMEVLSARRQAEHAAVDAALAACPGAAIRHDRAGAPLMEGAAVSISHAEGEDGRIWAAVAIGAKGGALGVDVERPRPQLARVAPRIFAEAELQGTAGEPRLQCVVWNVKEAAWKAFGPDLDYAHDIEILELPALDLLTEGGQIPVRVRDATHSFYVAFLDHGLSLAVGPV